MSTDKAVGPAVRVYEVAGELGVLAEFVYDRATEFGFPVVTDWAGNPGLAIEHAAEIVGRVRSDDEQHRAKWAEYQRYLAERKQAAVEERMAEVRKARREAEEEAKRANLHYSKEMQRKTEEEAGRRAAERARLEGKPLPWETFVRKAG